MKVIFWFANSLFETACDLLTNGQSDSVTSNSSSVGELIVGGFAGGGTERGSIPVTFIVSASTLQDIAFAESLAVRVPVLRHTFGSMAVLGR